MKNLINCISTVNLHDLSLDLPELEGTGHSGHPEKYGCLQCGMPVMPSIGSPYFMKWCINCCMNEASKSLQITEIFGAPKQENGES